MNKLSVFILFLGLLSIQAKALRGEEFYEEYEGEYTTKAAEESKQTQYMMEILGIVKDMALRKFIESDKDDQKKTEENYDEEVSKIMTILKDMVVEKVMGNSGSKMSSLVCLTVLPVAIAINNYV